MVGALLALLCLGGCARPTTPVVTLSAPTDAVPTTPETSSTTPDPDRASDSTSLSTPRPAPAVASDAVNLTPAESQFIRTFNDAADLQRALGTLPDGDFGPAGLARPGETRRAIAEFNTGQLRRASLTGPGSDTFDGKRDTWRALVAGGPLPPSLHSAFERGLLGAAPDCFAIRRAVAALDGPVVTATSTPECLAILRTALAARRAQPAMPAPMGRADALDSRLFDAGPAAPVFPTPPPATPVSRSP